MGEIDLVAQIADIKEINYKNTLAIASLIELLVEKNIIRKQEFAQKAKILEAITLSEIQELRARKKKAHP
jgi:hypothetical protein